MSYGKFAPKLKINNNPYYGNSWDAIGYAIGNALGNLWGANYNQRGIEKGEAEAQEALQKAYNKVYGNTQPAPESLQTQYEDVTGKMGVPQGQQGVPQSKDAATYIDTTKKYLGNNSKADTAGKTMKDMTPQRDIKAEKFDTFMSKYNSGTPNPDGDAQKVDALTQAANGNLANMDFSKLPSMSAEDLQSAIRKELRANGRTDYQINKVLENLSPAIKAKVQEGNNVNFGNLYERLNQQIKNGELDAANMTFTKMAELNPKMAAALQPKMKRAWDANAIEQNFQNKLNFYKKDPTLTERQAFNMAMYNSIFSPAEQYEFFGTSTPSKKRESTSNSFGSRGTGGGSAKGRKSGNDNGDGVQYRWSKYTEAEAAKKWAENILANDKATPEQRQMAIDTLKEVDRFYAKGSYVVPKEEVYSRIKKAIFDERLTPQSAYDWVFDDSGLGDAEKREIGTWLKDAYADDFNGDYNVSQDDQEYFFGKASNEDTTDDAPSRPSNKPLMQGGTLGEWLKGVGEAWDKAKAEAKRRKAQ